MLKDSFRLISKIQPDKKASNTNINTFLNDFNKFYYDVREKKYPSLPQSICDPYGFLLLCEDFTTKVKLDKNMQCHEIVKGEGHNDDVDRPYYKGVFTFPQLLNLLYRGYWFDYDLAIKIYNIQHDPLHIFKQIMNGRGYIMNRFRPNYKKVGKYMNYASESKITLDEDQYIPIPYIHRLCDGMAWPCFVTENIKPYNLFKGDIKGYGEGICVINGEENIIDVLKINDLWLTETPLANRLKFAENFKDLYVAPYVKAWSLRSAFDGARVIGANKEEGVLVRPCHEDFLSTKWFEWNETSLIYCCNIKNKLTTYNTKKSQPDFYTLSGDLGEINPIEERVNERMWLDDFDINEFQRILDLNE